MYSISIAPNEQGLLSVFEFEKQMIMILTDDEIRIAAQSWVGLTDAPNPNATSFAAGAKFVLQKLQQTPCTTLLLSTESPIEFIERRFVTADGVIEWNEQVKGYLLQKLGQ